jgi:hypothetical protein
LQIKGEMARGSYRRAVERFESLPLVLEAEQPADAGLLEMGIVVPDAEHIIVAGRNNTSSSREGIMPRPPTPKLADHSTGLVSLSATPNRAKTPTPW